MSRHGATYAHSFSEVRSQLEDAFYNVELIQIQFMDLRGKPMTDEFLIAQLKQTAEYLASRGMPGTSVAIETLIKRFETLQEAHRLLSEREESLTKRLVELTP